MLNTGQENDAKRADKYIGLRFIFNTHKVRGEKCGYMLIMVSNNEN
jgi:hypothetical protein